MAEGEAVTEGDADADAEVVSDTAPELDWEAEAEAEEEKLDDSEADTHEDSRGEGEAEWLALGLAVAEGDAVCVFEAEAEAVAVFDSVARRVPDTVAERDAGCADTVSVFALSAVREPPTEREEEGDPVGLLVSRGDALSDICELPVRVPRTELEAVEEADTEGVSENERVCEGVAEAHAVAVAVAEAERLTPAVRDAEGHIDWVRESRPLRLAEVEAVPPGEPLTLGVGCGLGLAEGATEAETAADEVGTTRSTSPIPRYSRPSLGARTSST